MTNLEFASELRKLADAYEENPELPVPCNGGYDTIFRIFQPMRSHIPVLLKVFGKLTKKTDPKQIDETALMYVTGQFERLGIQLIFRRSELCRVVTPAVMECDPILEAITE